MKHTNSDSDLTLDLSQKAPPLPGSPSSTSQLSPRPAPSPPPPLGAMLFLKPLAAFVSLLAVVDAKSHVKVQLKVPTLIQCEKAVFRWEGGKPPFKVYVISSSFSPHIFHAQVELGGHRCQALEGGAGWFCKNVRASENWVNWWAHLRPARQIHVDAHGMNPSMSWPGGRYRPTRMTTARATGVCSIAHL